MAYNAFTSFGEWSKNCWLHPVHGTPAQYPLEVAQKEGRVGLHHVLEEATSGLSELPWETLKPSSLCLTKLGIQVQDPDELSSIANTEASELIIPLEFSELLCAPVQLKVLADHKPTHVLLIAPEVPESDMHRPVWLICGHFYPSDLQNCLRCLGGRGAIRWDFVDSYQAVKNLGRGLHGKVFVGMPKAPSSKHQPSESQKRGVAIKVTGSDEACAKREIGLMSRLHQHPNISSLLEVFRFTETPSDCSRYALVMELGARGDVAKLLSRGEISQSRGISIMIGVTSALVYLHERRIVHRDVKPENVVLHADTRAMLIDFSIAASLDDPVELRKFLGTPGYLAPELIRRQPQTEAVDIFAAGVLWYAIMARHLPFHGEGTKEILASSVRCDVQLALESLQQSSEPGVRELLEGMLNKQPSRRLSARECFLKFWSLSDAKRKPACLESMMALVDAGLIPRLDTGDNEGQMEMIKSESDASPQGEDVPDETQLKISKHTSTATHVLDYVFQTFCFQRLHVFGTHQLLTVSAH